MATMNHDHDGNRIRPATGVVGQRRAAPANAHSEFERLRNAVKQEANIGNQGLLMYGAERAVARIAAAPIGEHLVLKGGFLLREILPPGVRRTTTDADFFANGISRETAVAGIVAALANPHADDHVVFDPSSVRSEEMQEDKGLRISYRGSLGSSEIVGSIDIGSHAAVVPAPDLRMLTPMLEHAEPIRVQAYPLPVIVAEKYETVVARDLANTRLKDFYDLAALARLGTISPEAIRTALTATCELRGTVVTPERPPALTPVYSTDAARCASWNRLSSKGSACKNQSLESVCDEIWAWMGPILRG